MADANPGIGGLSAATLLTLEESRSPSAAVAGTPAAPGPGPVPRPRAPGEGRTGPASWRAGRDRPPPNLGPPPPRPDWRKRRS